MRISFKTTVFPVFASLALLAASAQTVLAQTATFDNITVNNSVGIGVASSSTMLQIKSNGNDSFSSINRVGAQTVRIDNNGHLFLSSGYYTSYGQGNYLLTGGTGVFDFRGSSFAPATGRIQTGTLSVGTTSAPVGAVATFDGKVGIGTTEPVKMLHVANGGGTPAPVLIPGGVVQVLSSTASGSLEGVAATDATAHMPGLYLRSIRARGSLTSPTPVHSGDLLALWEAEGYDGASRAPAANIGMFAESVTASSPGSLVSGFINFLTTPSGGLAGPVERLRIDSTGNVGVGTMAPSQKLEINGGIRLNTTAAEPTCNSNTRGTFWYSQGATGVKDSVEVCAKDETDAYAWRTLY